MVQDGLCPFKSVIFDQPEHRVGVDPSGTGAHGQPVEGGVPHRRRNRLTVSDGTQRRTVSKMKAEEARRELLTGNVFERRDHGRVGQPVEPVAANALRFHHARDGIAGCYIRIGRVERGVKTCKLRQARREFRQCFYRGEVVRVVKRSKRRTCLYLRHHIGVQAYRLRKLSSSVNHAVRRGAQFFEAHAFCLERVQNGTQGCPMVDQWLRATFPVNLDKSTCADFSRDAGTLGVKFAVKDSELYRTGSSIQDEYIARIAHSAAMSVAEMPATSTGFFIASRRNGSPSS